MLRKRVLGVAALSVIGLVIGSSSGTATAHVARCGTLKHSQSTYLGHVHARHVSCGFARHLAKVVTRQQSSSYHRFSCYIHASSADPDLQVANCRRGRQRVHWIITLGKPRPRVAAAAAKNGAEGRAQPDTVLVPNSFTGTTRHKPKTVIVSMNVFVRHIHWATYNHHRAVGNGRAHINTCRPQCLGGNFINRRARVTFKDPRHCNRHRTVLTQLRLRLYGDLPSQYSHIYSTRLGSC